MTSLIIGSGSGLGKAIFEEEASISEQTYGFSRYTNSITFKNHELIGKPRAVNLLSLRCQDDFDELVRNLPNFDRVYYVIGGGYGLHASLPTFEQLFTLMSLNLFVPTSMLHSLTSFGKIGNSSRSVFISSIAAEEVVGSTGYSASKAALNAFVKVCSKEQKGCFGSFSTFVLGAMEGDGTSFDRLKSRNIEAYNQFTSSRLPYKAPIETRKVANLIMNTLSQEVPILDGLKVKVDANESLSI